MFARGCGQPIKEVHSLRPPTLDRARTRATCFGRGLNRGSAPILPSCPPSRTACSPAACSWGQQQPWAIPAAFRARWQCGDRGRSEHGHRLPSAGSRDPVSPQAAGRYPTSLQISALAIGGLRATHLEPGGAEREGWVGAARTWLQGYARELLARAALEEPSQAPSLCPPGGYSSPRHCSRSSPGCRPQPRTEECQPFHWI